MAVAYVQGESYGVDSGDTTAAVTLPGASGAGNLLMAAMTYSQNAAISSIADNNGNSYTQLEGRAYDSDDVESMMCFYAPNIDAGSTTITITFSGAVGFRRLTVTEYSGADLTSPINASDFDDDTTGWGTGTNAVVSSAIVPSVNNCMIWGAVSSTDTGSTWTAGTSPNTFTEREETTPTGSGGYVQVEDYFQATAASVSAVWTASDSSAHVHMYVAAIQPPTGPAVETQSFYAARRRSVGR